MGTIRKQHKSAIKPHCTTCTAIVAIVWLATQRNARATGIPAPKNDTTGKRKTKNEKGKARTNPNPEQHLLPETPPQLNPNYCAIHESARTALSCW